MWPYFFDVFILEGEYWSREFSEEEGLCQEINAFVAVPSHNFVQITASKHDYFVIFAWV